MGLLAHVEAAQEGGGRGVAGVRAGEDAVGVQLVEGEVEEGAGRLGRVALAAGVGVEDVADLDLSMGGAAQPDAGVAEEQAVVAALDREREAVFVLLQVRLGHAPCQRSLGLLA